MVKVQKIAPYNFEFRKISVLSSQIDCSITPVYEYFYKKNPEHIYCNGIKNASIRNNCINGTSLWVKNISNKYKEYYVSFIDLTYKTVEQAKKALEIFNSNKNTLEQEVSIVEMLDSAEEIVLDDSIHIRQQD